jgi:methyl-accepting chemotaxis protein
MARHKTERRKNYFIDKNFQAKFIIKFCLLIVSASLLIGILIYHFNLQTNTVAFENLKVVVKSTSDFILPIMLQILVIVTLLVGIATIVVTLFTSHKISGPLYRLNAELEKIKKRNLSSDIHIRADDQLQKIVSELDEMRAELKNSVKTLKENWNSIKVILHKLKEEAKDEKQKRHISDNIERIDSELSSFKTD